MAEPLHLLYTQITCARSSPCILLLSVSHMILFHA